MKIEQTIEQGDNPKTCDLCKETSESSNGLTLFSPPHFDDPIISICVHCFASALRGGYKADQMIV